jgi:hypothetical protein
VTCPAISRSNHLAAEYEALRGSVLQGQRSGGHFGLVIVLREGLAAWMAHACCRPVTIAGATCCKRSSPAAPIVPKDVRANMIAVLASMVRVEPQEQCL